jgi:hypothetical protein
MKTSDTDVAHSERAKSTGSAGGSSGYRWLAVALFAVLAILSALSFLRYVGWAAFYSGTFGLSSRVSEAQFAGRKAQLFFWAFLVLEGFATFAVASLIQLTEIWSTAVRVVARLAIALALSLIVTVAVIGVLVAVGSKLR